MSQEQAKKSTQSKKTEEVLDEIPKVETKEGLDDDIDAILADIDEVLEENAQDFVEAFVQKGGE